MVCGGHLCPFSLLLGFLQQAAEKLTFWRQGIALAMP